MRCTVDIAWRLQELEVHYAGSEAAWVRKSFENGTWRGEIWSELKPQPNDIVALEHWCSSDFANTI